MNIQQYHKGHLIVWIGVGFGAVFRVLILLATPGNSGLQPYIPWGTPIIPLFSLLSLVGLATLLYGAILVLKSKNRSWAWVFLIFFLNIIGLMIIFFTLKDKSQTEVSLDQVSNTPSIQDYIKQSRASGMTNMAIAEELKKSGWGDADITNSLK